MHSTLLLTPAYLVAAQRQNESYKEVELDVDTVDNAKEIGEANNFNEADIAIAN